MSPKVLMVLLSALSVSSGVAALDPSIPPGQNFNLSPFQLQLPTGTQNNPDTKQGSDLTNFQDYNHFFTESGDGAMVMKAEGYPGQYCVKYAESQHCRTELGETAHWSPAAGTNHLHMELLAPTSVNGGANSNNICIGQVFQADGNPDHNKPFAELYYYSNGSVIIGTAYSAEGGAGQDLKQIGVASRGTRFSYDLYFQNNVWQVGFNGGAPKTYTKYFTPSGAFFKAGDYNQDTQNTGDIHVFALTINH